MFPRNTKRNNLPSMKPVATVLSCALMFASALAGADVPPPAGIKRVPYAFRVDGLDKFSDHVVFAYPWSLSNGAPTREITAVNNATSVYVGNRSPNPELYATKKSTWEVFARDNRSFRDPTFEDAVTKLILEAASCNVKLTRGSEIPAADPRSEVVEVFAAQAIGDGKCSITAAGQGAEGTVAAPKELPGSKDSAPPKGGCAGCAIATGPRDALGYALFGLLFAFQCYRARIGRRQDQV